MQHLFLQQSYLDCYEAYQKSLDEESAIRWDYVVLTASNENQAETYREQIRHRLEHGRLPGSTEYVVLPDPDGKRVGSGGATLHVLRYIAARQEAEKQDTEKQWAGRTFAGRRILVIHSGGDSKRVPQYSLCGKLFSPVPRMLPDGSPSTLFDEFMIGMAGVAGRLKEGMLVLSGDVLLLFNPLQIDFTFRGAAALSIKAPMAVGQEHGVFLNDGNDFVGQFLHKQPGENLRRLGAVNEQGMVDLDTGAVALDAELMEALYSLVCTGGIYSEERFAQFVNERARISFYGDFLYPLAGRAGLEDYLAQAAEGEMCEELLECRRKIWEVLSAYKMRLISLSPAEFIHFGTTAELLQLMTREIGDYAFLGWSRLVLGNTGREDFAVYDSVIEDSSGIGENVYVEHCRVHRGVRIGSGSIVSGLELGSAKGEKVVIPPGVVLHGLRMKDGGYVARIYEVGLNPKDKCGRRLTGSLLKEVGEETPLWEARLYPVCGSWEEAVSGALIALRMMRGGASVEEKNWWLEHRRTSLQESFNCGDSGGFLSWCLELEDEIRVRRFAAALEKKTGWEEAVSCFGRRGITDRQYGLLEETARRADFSTRIRIYYALMQYGKQRGADYEKYGALCFGAIRDTVYQSAADRLQSGKEYRIRQEEVSVELPVRVNWGGGWTDTPPYCLEQGGTVLNAAIRLNGICPVQVTARRLQEPKILVASEDVGAFGEITSTAEVQDYGNPYDSFALHKAALIACGVIPLKGGDLKEILTKLGGGIFLSTQVIGVPKGSGLGTSSILGGACVKALFELMGEEISQEQLYDIVLCMEQLMSTGGGWQDQVGGVTGGIKFITSGPGIRQRLKVQQVEVPREAMEELSRRFALIYTGQRRLARNLLRDVVGGYIGGRPQSLDALFRMQRTAALMRFELEKGNIDGFASLLNEHWELSRQLDEGSTNTCIEEIFRACGDLIDGRFIAGAGGGGFLQVILKKGVSREALQKRLTEVFQDSGVAVWECEFCEDI